MTQVKAYKFICTLHTQSRAALEGSSLQGLRKEKPNISINYILKRINPAKLRNNMKSFFEWRKDECFEKKDFDAYLPEFADQWRELEEGKETKKSHLSAGEDSSSPSDVARGRSWNIKSTRRNESLIGMIELTLMMTPKVSLTGSHRQTENLPAF